MQSLKDKASHLLHSSERLFKLDMVYIAKGSLWTTSRFIISTLVSIITMVAYGNLLPRETYGIYTYLLSLGASLSFLTLSGASIGVMRAVAKGNENVIPVALRLQIKYNLIAITTVLSASIYYGYKGNMLFAWSLAILAFAYPLSEAFHIYEQILTARKRFDILTIATSIITLVGAAVTVMTLLLTQNILILITVYATMSLLPNIIVYLITTRSLTRATPDPEQINEMRRTAFHTTGAGLIGTVAKYVDKIVLFQVAGPAALAVYAFATAGPERLKSLIKGWLSIALPRLTQKPLSEIRQDIYKRISIALLIGFVLFLIYLSFAPILFTLFLPRYLDAIVYSQVLSLSLIVAPISIYIGGVFASQNMLRATYVLNIGIPVARIALYVIFVWQWQIWGLIVASILSSLINAVYSIIIWEVEVRRISKQS